jgi:hypothetical protein
MAVQEEAEGMPPVQEMEVTEVSAAGDREHLQVAVEGAEEATAVEGADRIR